MQKQFLLNTLLLIGAICLSTRGLAQSEPIFAGETIEAAASLNAENTSASTSAQRSDNLTNVTSSYTSLNQDESAEDMD